MRCSSHLDSVSHEVCLQREVTSKKVILWLLLPAMLAATVWSCSPTSFPLEPGSMHSPILRPPQRWLRGAGLCVHLGKGTRGTKQWRRSPSLFFTLPLSFSLSVYTLTWPARSTFISLLMLEWNELIQWHLLSTYTVLSSKMKRFYESWGFPPAFWERSVYTFPPFR